MPPRPSHPKKDIEKALKSAENDGWIVTTRPGHAWGQAVCGSGCRVMVWSTPQNTGNHAKKILRAVTKCPH